MDYIKKLSILVGGIVGLSLAGAGIWWHAAPRGASGSVLVAQPKAERLRFLAVGDTGTGGDAQLVVAARMESRCKSGVRPTAILLLGDNFYQDGVASAEDEQWQSKMWKPYGSECLSTLPIYGVLGNHDYKGNPGAQIEQSGKIPRWHMPARNYVVRFDDMLELVALDSNTVDRCFIPSLCTIDFLDARVHAAERAHWNILLAHHPLVSASAKHLDEKSELYRNRMKPSVCGGMDVMLTGHAHHMEHGRLAGCPTEFFVSGGGGADLYETLPNKEGSRFARSAHGFLDINVEPQSMNLTFVDVLGEEVYRFTITKP